MAGPAMARQVTTLVGTDLSALADGRVPTKVGTYQDRAGTLRGSAGPCPATVKAYSL